MSKSRKNNKTSLGKGIVNAHNRKYHQGNKPLHHVADLEEVAVPKLKSVIDPSTLNDYLNLAELEAKKYEALRETKIRTEHVVIDMNALYGLKDKPNVNEKDVSLTIPRRPKWDSKTTAEQLADAENKNFLNWRRDLAKTEEELLAHKTFTPFEKNIEVWKQLWRVIEKSDIVVQIVDGRNPLFFRCPDLEKYVKEADINKENILLINKSDLLSEEIRKIWNEYFIKNGIKHIFFSAKEEQERINLTDDLAPVNVDVNAQKDLSEDSWKLCNREDLLYILKKIAQGVRDKRLASNAIKTEPQNQDPKEEVKSVDTKRQHIHEPKPNEVTIGMVGYPNVGKSSAINVLCKKKLVGVAAQPGKTKHFQTIFLEKELLLCDCPGLVFPNFTSSRAEMVCNGVLPIDNIKDYLTPIQFLTERIPKYVFELIYHIKIDYPTPTAPQVLQALGKFRGHLTGRGIPAEAKCAKAILKDFVNGKVLYCAMPPDYVPNSEKPIVQHNRFDPKEMESLKQKQFEEKLPDEMLEVLEEFKGKEDKKFFDAQKEMITLEDLDLEDIEALQQGRSAKGIKLTKQQRRDIKFALQRGEPIDIRNFIDGGMPNVTGAKSCGKFADPNYKKSNITLNPLQE